MMRSKVQRTFFRSINSRPSRMYKLFTLISVFLSAHLFTYVAADIPTYPAVWDPNFPLNRCVDFCAFLKYTVPQTDANS